MINQQQRQQLFEIENRELLFAFFVIDITLRVAKGQTKSVTHISTSACRLDCAGHQIIPRPLLSPLL
jgi:hypothetical protein